MTENLGPSPEDLGIEQGVSRFGEKEHIVDVMRSGEPHVIGSVDDLYPDEIAAHQNVVEVVQLLRSKFEGRDTSNNVTQPVMLHFGAEQPMLCLFKPYDGENSQTKSQHNIASFYPREVAGYHVSEHFGFDLVPPTTVRELGGRIGALQLFMEPPQYISGEKYFYRNDDDEWDLLQRSRDFQAIAAFDYILGNTDRKDANYLLKVDEQRKLVVDQLGEPEMIAIDHGLTLDTFTFGTVEILGPILGLTYDNQARKPRKVELPDWLHNQLDSGYKRKSELDLTFLPDIPQQQIEDMWKRANNLIQLRHFLSPENHVLFIKK